VLVSIYKKTINIDIEINNLHKKKNVKRFFNPLHGPNFQNDEIGFGNTEPNAKPGLPESWVWIVGFRPKIELQ
jgi:hypothetical protein